jgi:hypothetical protein
MRKLSWVGPPDARKRACPVRAGAGGKPTAERQKWAPSFDQHYRHVESGLGESPLLQVLYLAPCQNNKRERFQRQHSFFLHMGIANAPLCNLSPRPSLHYLIKYSYESKKLCNMD